MTTPSHESVITKQPTTIGSAASLSCPPGLEYLSALQGLFVRQLSEPLEIFTGLETANRYEIFDTFGQRIFFAAEVSHPCVVLCGGKNRPFIIQLMNFVGAPVLTISRDCSCSMACGCSACGGNEIVVTHIGGEIMGTATQQFSCCTPEFILKNGAGQTSFVIRGPSCGDCCRFFVMGPCCTASFRVMLPDGSTEVGCIRKQADLREIVSDANSFGITFNVPLTPKEKALILGAVFVIDFGYFESSGQNQQRQHRHF